MSDPDEALRALNLVAVKRGAMADRVRVPGWYAGLYAAGLLLVFLSPNATPKTTGILTFFENASVPVGVAVAVSAATLVAASRMAAVAATRHDLRTGRAR